VIRALAALCSVLGIAAAGAGAPVAGAANASVAAAPATVLTLEGGLVGVQHIFHFTPFQLQGALCASPNACRPVDYLALPGDAFNEAGADLLEQAVDALPDRGGPVTLFGHSQGGQVIYAALRRWAADPSTAPDPSRVSWVSIGNPENPYGGVVEKLGLKPAPRLPVDTAYQGIEVIRQYDGWADWPTDQANLLAVANAVVGALTVHPRYDNVNLDDPKNVRYTPDKPDGTPGNVTYVWVPNPRLPLIAGTGPLEPILDKMLRPIIEAGYHRPGVSSVASAQAVSATTVAKPVSRARAASSTTAKAIARARPGITKNRS
jgi:pimeloyl-ACP methyl ester carboxylesterase